MTNHYMPTHDDTHIRPDECEDDLCTRPACVSYRLFCDEQEAIHFGTATELTECYLCPSGSPLRGILDRTCNMRHPDPTEVQHLSCGHHII